MTTAVEGFQAKLGIDTANPVTAMFDFLNESIALDQAVVDGTGLRGQIDYDISRCRDGIEDVGGDLEMTPSAAELALLLPWILNGTPSGSSPITYPLADACATRYITIDRSNGTDGKVFTYAGAGVGRATFRASQGQMLRLSLDIVAQTETVANAGTFPGLTIGTDNAWIFEELVLSIGGTNYPCNDFSLLINKYIDRNRRFNSLTLPAIISMNRRIFFQTSLPYGLATAVYGSAGAAGAAVVATFTNAANSKVLTMTMAKVAFPRKSPTVPGRSEVMLPVIGEAKRNGATMPLVVTIA